MCCLGAQHMDKRITLDHAHKTPSAIEAKTGIGVCLHSIEPNYLRDFSRLSWWLNLAPPLNTSYQPLTYPSIVPLGLFAWSALSSIYVNIRKLTCAVLRYLRVVKSLELQSWSLQWSARFYCLLYVNGKHMCCEWVFILSFATLILITPIPTREWLNHTTRLLAKSLCMGSLQHGHSAEQNSLRYIVGRTPTELIRINLMIYCQ